MSLMVVCTVMFAGVQIVVGIILYIFYHSCKGNCFTTLLFLIFF
jgi:hypothetical protein